jgi:hypothetical protein
MLLRVVRHPLGELLVVGQQESEEEGAGLGEDGRGLRQGLPLPVAACILSVSQSKYSGFRTFCPGLLIALQVLPQTFVTDPTDPSF